MDIVANYSPNLYFSMQILVQLLAVSLYQSCFIVKWRLINTETHKGSSVENILLECPTTNVTLSIPRDHFRKVGGKIETRNQEELEWQTQAL